MGEIKANDMYTVIANLLHKARRQVKRVVNTTMVRTYFEIGRIIVEEEQRGKERASYGKGQNNSDLLKLSISQNIILSRMEKSHTRWSDPNSEIVKSVNSFAGKSSEILKPILEG